MAKNADRIFKDVSLVDRLVDAIRDNIIGGELEPAAHIGIKKIAEQYGVSMIPVREALARLLSSRLVTAEANRGYFVAARPTLEEFSQFVDARVLFETSAVQSGFSNATDADLAGLRKLNAKMLKVATARKSDTMVEWGNLNVEFHKILVGLGRNAFISNIYDDLSFGNLHFQLIRSSSEEFPDLEKLVAEHDNMITALADSDQAGLLSSLSTHIRNVITKA